MKKTETLLIGLVVIALLMDFFHLQGAGVLLVLSLLFLSMMYMYLGFALFNNIQFRKIFKKDTYREISAKRIIGAIGAGLALSVCVIGILFKFQSYPGATMNLIIGVIGLAVVSIISVFKMQKSTDNYYSNILKRAVIFGTICIFLLLIPTEMWLNLRYPNNPEYVQAIVDAKADPDNEELWEIVDVESEKMYDEEDD